MVFKLLRGESEMVLSAFE